MRNSNTVEQDIEKQERVMTEIEAKFPGGLRDIYSYAKCDDSDDNPDRESVRLSKLANQWKSAHGGLMVLREIQAQRINPNALNQYRDDLQR